MTRTRRFLPYHAFMLESLLVSWLVLAAIVWLTAKLLPGFSIKGLGGALMVAALFGLLNVLIGWLLFVVIGIGTLGLGFILAFVTRWLVDAILLKIVDAMTERLTIKSFGRAMLAALLMSGLGTLFELAMRAT
ncbi:MAG: phage holin family protein [Myxococcota bacterium]